MNISLQNSFRAFNICLSSVEHPDDGVPSGHFAWGRLKSPPKMMSGVGVMEVIKLFTLFRGIIKSLGVDG